MEKRSQKRLFLILKIAVAVGALAFVFYNIDRAEVARLFGSANIGYVLLAIVLFVVSKLVAAFRLQVLFRALPVNISHRANIELYLLGMFYNLFLPGGIGGDGYKAYLLNKTFETPYKRLIGALLADRLSGMTALCMIAVAFVPFTQLEVPGGWAVYALIPLGGGVFWAFLHFLFPYLKQAFFKITGQSLIVQGVQAVAVYFLLLSLSTPGDLTGYLFLFLISSIVSVIPISLGGAGTRELTFLFGAQYLGLDESVSVAISLMFYLIQALVSAVGGYYVAKPVQLEEAAAASEAK